MLSQHQFIFQTWDKKLNFTNQSPRYFPRITLMDSIFRFFNYAEVIVDDKISMIPDYLFFVEGLEFNILLGNEEDGFMQANYVWGSHQINQTIPAVNVAGNNVFMLRSKYYGLDKYFIRAWDDTILNVVKDVIKKDYNLTPGGEEPKVFLSLSTTGKTKHYQLNETNHKFLTRLSSYAYTQNHPQSGFLTFFNCMGEFYFMSLSELYNQTAAASFYLVESPERTIDPRAIQNITTAYLGITTNKKNYKKTIYKFSESGQFSDQEVSLETYFLKKGREKFLALKTNQVKIKNTYIGLINTSVDTEYESGVINGFFNNSMLSYRLEIIVHFNPYVTSGKTIEIDISSGTKQDQKSLEFSGKWLVCSAKHYMDIDGVPFSKLELVKPGIELDKDNVYYNEFIS